MKLIEYIAVELLLRIMKGMMRGAGIARKAAEKIMEDFERRVMEDDAERA